MSTDHNDAIEQALFDAQGAIDFTAYAGFNKDKLRAILTDLAAEIRAHTRKEEAHYLDRAVESADRMEDENDTMKARLAAVERKLLEFLPWCDNDIQRTQMEGVIAIARGEGGVQASGVKDEAAHDRGCDQASVPTEPAAPDAPQITMHTLDLDHLRGECRECGREPEHPCHGETRHQQSPASDGDLDEIVREAHVELSRHFSGQFALIQRALRAACIRAREIGAIEGGKGACRAHRRKLAAVRAWRDKWREHVVAPADRELDAILDGKEAEENA